MSCHSCHTDGHANGLLADTLGDGTAGTPKRVQTLLGGRDANPWGWTGEARELHEQVAKSIRSTMQGPPRPMTQVIDLVAYLHTLPPAPPLLPATDDPADRALLDQGRKVFSSAGCMRCHIPPLTYTTDSSYDVGLHDEAGRKQFNPPSLLGVSQRDSLFHDARAKTLEDVLDQGHFSQPPPDPRRASVAVAVLEEPVAVERLPNQLSFGYAASVVRSSVPPHGSITFVTEQGTLDSLVLAAEPLVPRELNPEVAMSKTVPKITEV